jgi:exodeoxyribonuclease-3
MKILSWNVNGIRSVCRKGLIKILHKINADIICIQELKTHETAIPNELRQLLGYQLLVNPAERKGYSGVALLTRRRVQSVSYTLGLERFDREGRMLEAEIEGLTVINLYMPHGGRQQEHMEYKLEAYASLLTRVASLVNQPAILLGDFNIARTKLDLARFRQNKRNTMFTPFERNTLKNLVNMGWIDSYRKSYPNRRQYSWWPWVANCRSRTIGWRIDYVFTSPSIDSYILDAFILDEIHGSDHCPIGLELQES